MILKDSLGTRSTNGKKITSQTEELVLTVVHHCGPKPAVAGITVHLSKSRLFVFLFYSLSFDISQSEQRLRVFDRTNPSSVRARACIHSKLTRQSGRWRHEAQSKWQQSHVDEMVKGHVHLQGENKFCGSWWKWKLRSVSTVLGSLSWEVPRLAAMLILPHHLYTKECTYQLHHPHWLSEDTKKMCTFIFFLLRCFQIALYFEIVTNLWFE